MKNKISWLITFISIIVCLTGKAEAKEIKEVHFLNIPEEESTEEVIEETTVIYDSIDMLARCVEAEAGNQGLLGKRLVVDVILNRVDDPRFPNDVASVISAPGQFAVYPYMMQRVTVSQETLDAIVLELERRTDSRILYFNTRHFKSWYTAAYQCGDHYFGY